jgi:hypothetical protein
MKKGMRGIQFSILSSKDVCYSDYGAIVKTFSRSSNHLIQKKLDWYSLYSANHSAKHIVTSVTESALSSGMTATVAVGGEIAGEAVKMSTLMT